MVGIPPRQSQGWLALTAHASNFDGESHVAADTAAAHVGAVCHVAIDGRRASRALVQWCERFELSEPEFQVLWFLRAGTEGGFDQTTLVKRLAFSPAQVSTTVERLRARGWISQHASAADRRRNLWFLTLAGGHVIGKMLQAAHELNVELRPSSSTERASVAREAAA